MKRKIKIGLISSRGGHLLQLYKLKPWWSSYTRFWVTGKGEDSKYLLKNEVVHYAHFPEHRNALNAIRNLFLACKILIQEKPTLLISMGAGVAPPFFLVGKLLKCKLIFIESISFIHSPSLTTKMVAPFVDKLIFQHKNKKGFKNALYWGSLL